MLQLSYLVESNGSEDGILGMSVCPTAALILRMVDVVDSQVGVPGRFWWENDGQVACNPGSAFHNSSGLSVPVLPIL